ncbi:MAG TPA: YbaB/EbfC family nucleoid-associated protein [Actinophytocola sp.]|uniref:YbaB/EbfC family nucleoid-associated protein n=1 Tax=Actinophytocola sp. TaxID=1872138 RepID=UPI002DB5637D|nr:YbaB/EbfC family nucleoid-associated protein [Actinophytocola sp.]HEU5473273.1 YbaB/EbfC family nucleoid-associated protein [Actinophytocola sp.]
MTPEQWLSNFEAKIAEVQQKAAEFKENLESSGATESSADGSLRVTVAPNGALTDLTIADSALRGSGGELAAQIMRLARKAQRAAAVHVAEAFAPLAGEDSESLRMVTGYLPPEEDEDPPAAERRPGYAFTDEPEDAEPPARPPAEPSGRPGRPRSTARDDDDDEFGGDQIFGRRDEW